MTTRSKELPPIERLRELYRYDPETGVLRRAPGKGCPRGSVMGAKSNQPYIQVRIGGRIVKAHRLIWALVYGTWPPEIDHIDCDGRNNRLSNLRLATRSQNGANRRPWKNKQLPKGVTLHRGAYVAQIRAGGRLRYLGRFKCPEEAHAAYCAEALKAHGEFARFA